MATDAGLYEPSIEEIAACRGDWIFSDGGVIYDGKGIYSRSTIGCTWAWCHVRDGEMIAHASGTLTPTMIGLPSVTNNTIELYALVRAMETFAIQATGKRRPDRPLDVPVTIVSDSRCSLLRRLPGAKTEGLPVPLIRYSRAWFRYFATSCPRPRFVLVDGHPKPHHLESGVGKRGNRVSKWNLWADEECTRIKPEPLKKE